MRSRRWSGDGDGLLERRGQRPLVVRRGARRRLVVERDERAVGGVADGVAVEVVAVVVPEAERAKVDGKVSGGSGIGGTRCCCCCCHLLALSLLLRLLHREERARRRRGVDLRWMWEEEKKEDKELGRQW